MLTEFKEQAPSHRDQGIAVHLVTSEPPDTDTIAARLAERGVTDLGIPLHSDPENRLLSSPAESFYVVSEMKASQYNKKEGDDYSDYQMVQPAMIVLDAAGTIVQQWSWLTMGVDQSGQQSEGPESGWTLPLTKLPNPDPDHPQKEVPLVTVRPMTRDIARSINEGRPVKLAAVFYFN